MRPLALAVAAVLAACGGDREGVAVTEAEPVGRVAPLPPGRTAPLDTVYADSGLYADPRLDSLLADSAARADALEPADAAPDFRRFWPRFQRALRTSPDSVEALARLRPGSAPVEAVEGPFLDRALALTARDFRRDGTVRDVQIRVGYDPDGRVVPEDEAATESSVTLRFEVVDGAYRLVRVDMAG